MTAAKRLPTPSAAAPVMPAIGKRAGKKKPVRNLITATALPTAHFACQVAFEMPVVLVTELNMREHWRARHGRTVAQKEMTQRCLAAFATWRWDLRNPIRVVITRIAPKAFDKGDNAEASGKHVRDQLAQWLGVNDRDPDVEWKVEQERRGAREYGCRVTIEEVTPETRVAELRALLAEAERVAKGDDNGR